MFRLPELRRTKRGGRYIGNYWCPGPDGHRWTSSSKNPRVALKEQRAYFAEWESTHGAAATAEATDITGEELPPEALEALEAEALEAAPESSSEDGASTAVVATDSTAAAPPELTAAAPDEAAPAVTVPASDEDVGAFVDGAREAIEQTGGPVPDTVGDAPAAVEPAADAATTEVRNTAGQPAAATDSSAHPSSTAAAGTELPPVPSHDELVNLLDPEFVRVGIPALLTAHHCRACLEAGVEARLDGLPGTKVSEETGKVVLDSSLLLRGVASLRQKCFDKIATRLPELFLDPFLALAAIEPTFRVLLKRTGRPLNDEERAEVQKALQAEAAAAPKPIRPSDPKPPELPPAPTQADQAEKPAGAAPAAAPARGRF